MHLNLKDGVIYSVMEFCETISSYSADTIMICAAIGSSNHESKYEFLK